MRQAIMTAYHGPTNTKGSRVSAKAEAGRVTRHWDHALNSDENHCAVASALAFKLDWSGLWIGGGMARGDVYVWAGDVRPDAEEARSTIGIEGRDWFYIIPVSRGA